MKKNLLIIMLIVVVLFLSFMIGTGFMERTDVALGEYYVSEDGRILTFQAGVTSSMGYTRGFKDHGGGVKPHYLTFYSTFGGLNSSLGAKNEFTLVLDENDTEIYFGRADGGYELVLQKDIKTGEWVRPEQVQEVSVVKTYEKTEAALVEEYLDNNNLIVMVKHYEMSDGTWKASGLSSNMDDYFDVEDAKFVAMK